MGLYSTIFLLVMISVRYEWGKYARPYALALLCNLVPVYIVLQA